jgi:hypothetical protein
MLDAFGIEILELKEDGIIESYFVGFG